MTAIDVLADELAGELAARVASADVEQALEVALQRTGVVVVAPGDLFGPGEAAAYLGVNRTTVSRWNRESYMPTPLQSLGGAPVWTRAQLDVFKQQHEASADKAGRRPLGSAAGAADA